MNSMGGSGRGGFDTVGGGDSSSTTRTHQQSGGSPRQKRYVTSVGSHDRFCVNEELLEGILDGRDEKRPIVAAAASTASLLGAGMLSTHPINTSYQYTPTMLLINAPLNTSNHFINTLSPISTLIDTPYFYSPSTPY